MPGDKSVSHRALMFSALCEGEALLRGLTGNADVTATRDCLAQMGIRFESQPDGSLRVHGRRRWEAPPHLLDCRNSGTSMRLLAGILSAQPFGSVLSGDVSLCKRPMGRIIKPLGQMGAHINSFMDNGLPPLVIQPTEGGLHGIAYELPMASAQVKSALMLAGLFADGETRLKEPEASRDHTERLLRHLGADVKTEADGAILLPGRQIDRLQARDLTVPGDPSSAAFFTVAALGVPGSSIRLENLCLNPGRIGLFEALKRVGADIRYENQRLRHEEPVGDVIVQASVLKGDLHIAAGEVPALVDEIPVLAAAALFLEGTLTVSGAEELRHKESDRIQTLAEELGKLGVNVAVQPDGFVIAQDPARRLGTPVAPLESHHDHRIAMMLRTVNRIMDSELWPMHGEEWTDVSFPGFREMLYR